MESRAGKRVHATCTRTALPSANPDAVIQSSLMSLARQLSNWAER